MPGGCRPPKFLGPPKLLGRPPELLGVSPPRCDTWVPYQVPKEEVSDGAAGVEGENLKGVQGGPPVGTQLLGGGGWGGGVRRGFWGSRGVLGDPKWVLGSLKGVLGCPNRIWGG